MLVLGVKLPKKIGHLAFQVPGKHIGIGTIFVKATGNSWFSGPLKLMELNERRNGWNFPGREVISKNSLQLTTRAVSCSHLGQRLVQIRVFRIFGIYPYFFVFLVELVNRPPGNSSRYGFVHFHRLEIPKTYVFPTANGDFPMSC